MILGFAIKDGRLVALDDPLAAASELAWLDLVSPSAEEEAAVEAALSVDVPTREEMQEIEISSRLYHNEGVVFMTASVPVRSDSENPVAAPITFMLAGNCLITVRYAEPTAIAAFRAHAMRAQLGCHEGDTVLIGLLEAIVDRLADILEKTGGAVSGQTELIFAVDERKPRHPEEFRRLLRDLGRAGDLISQVQESLVGLQRMFAFLQNTTRAAERS
ncbi:MAG: magnesium transporter, partial [Hyphomicrobiales bacterium]|nr:magnesium transporter [Hyphomicrobiales bacterium]